MSRDLVSAENNMQSHWEIVAESTLIYRLFTNGPIQVSLSAETLRFVRFSGGTPSMVPVGTITAIIVEPSWFWSRLRVQTLDGKEYSAGGLGKQEAARIRELVTNRIDLQANDVEQELKRVDTKVRSFLDGTRYVRHSASFGIHESITLTVHRCQGLVREHLDHEAREALGRLEPLVTPARFEAARERANTRFVRDTIPRVKQAAPMATSSSFGLTDEQAEAVVTDEDVTLVLAGAGTGKTAVITSKVAHLVCNEGVSPSEILVLAFNRKTAEEIRGRLVGLAVENVFTFHALGRRIIAHANGAPTVSSLAHDQRSLSDAIRLVLGNPLEGNKNSDGITDFIAYHPNPYQSPFSCRTFGEYYKYVRNSELRTLTGVLVKSSEELEIANYLSLHNINFRYEEPYVMPTATKEHRQYKPDFYLPDYDIYIEYFALDKNGKPPPGWHEYIEGVRWKRSIHRQYGTRLIETQGWQHEKGILRPTLRKKLEAVGVPFNRIPAHILIDQFRQWMQRLLSWLVQLLTTFLNHVKTSRLSSNELRRRAQCSSDPVRSETFLNLFDLVKNRYETLLAQKGELDFHDLINLAIDLIHNGTCPKPYRYILVDEFQDISAGRMELLQALQKEDTAYFFVGDDWQSIYRFAGSDVGLMQSCDASLGSVRERVLSQTFRFGDDILKPSTDFVRQNPVQSQKSLRPNPRADDHGITIIGASEQAKGLHTALEDIKQLSAQEHPLPFVLVLGRYRDSAQLSNNTPSMRVEFSTVHAAKGREADFVIVLDLKNGQRGFLSQMEDDPLIELVLPPDAETIVAHAEERRLFYVAMTRAKRGVYLITDTTRPSPFATELKKSFRDTRQLGEIAGYEGPVCPQCIDGTLVASQTRKNLRCTNQPFCNYLAPRCPSCDGGYAVVTTEPSVCICTNTECTRPPSACPRCGLGVLMEKSGPYGPFWGCTGYRSEPPCQYTKNVESMHVSTHV